MKGELLKRLSKEKPERKTDELTEALKQGYSWEQIFRAKQIDMQKVFSDHIYLKYSGIKGNFEIPYSYENYILLCWLLMK